MDTAYLTSPEVEHALRISSWCLIGFGALWLITSVLGFFHRRAYNLTHAESGGSKNIQPDFLKVDKAKRAAAIARGEAYDATLKEREAAVSPKTVAKVCSWSRILATTAALLTLVTTVVGALDKVETFQADVEKVGTWDRFTHLISQNAAGTIIAVAVIAANVIVVVQKLKKPE